MSAPVILTVDDDKTVLDSLKAQLKLMFGARFGYEAAESAAEAWEVIDELQGDEVPIVIIVSDWLMPEIKGDDFLRRVRRKHPSIGRIMLTGFAEAEALAAVHEGALAHRLLHKPWRKEDLSLIHI